jgi:hypothetical protein
LTYHRTASSGKSIPPGLPRSVSTGAISTATTSLPATDVFHATALPLHLPHLDAYLDSIGPPAFSDADKLIGPYEQKAWRQWIEFGRVGNDVPKRVVKSAHQSARRSIFPPLHLLPSGLSLADLKLNRRSSLPFFSLNQLLGTAVDGILGGQGSSYASAFLTLELFRDRAPDAHASFTC